MKLVNMWEAASLLTCSTGIKNQYCGALMNKTGYITHYCAGALIISQGLSTNQGPELEPQSLEAATFTYIMREMFDNKNVT